MSTDAELIDRARDDPSAFRALYDRQGGRSTDTTCAAAATRTPPRT